MRIYVVQHTHTDRGFTHRRAVVKAGMQLDFLDQAVRFAGEDEDFRWTCEASEAVWNYLTVARSRKAAEALLNAVRRGQIDVAPHWAHITFCPDADTFSSLLDCAWDLRNEFGITPAPGMVIDVNGIHWGIVDLLSEIRSPGLISALNTWMGGAPLPRPQLFHWEGPSGRTMPVWLGEHYMFGNDLGIECLEKVGGIEEVVGNLMNYLRFIQTDRGYDKDALLLELSAIYVDNGPPGPQICRNIRMLNDRLAGEGVGLSLATATEAFAAVLKSWEGQTQTFRGEWPDWWSALHCGAKPATAARAAGLLRQRKVLSDYMKGQGRCEQMLAASDAAERRARLDLLQYCEHSSFPYFDEETAVEAAEGSLAYLGVFPHLRAPVSTPPVLWTFNTHPFAHRTLVEVDLEWWMCQAPEAVLAVEDLHSGTLYPAQAEQVALNDLVHKVRLSFAAPLPAREPRGFRLRWSEDPAAFAFDEAPQRPEGFYQGWVDDEAEYPLSTLISEEVRGYGVFSYFPQGGPGKRAIEEAAPEPSPEEVAWLTVPREAAGPVYRSSVRFVSLPGCRAAWVELREYASLGWLRINATLLPDLGNSSFMIFMSVPLKGMLKDLHVMRPMGPISYAEDLLPGACRTYLLHTGGVWVTTPQGFTAMASTDFPMLFPGGMNIGGYGKLPRRLSQSADLYFNLFNSRAYLPASWLAGCFFMAAGQGGRDDAIRSIRGLNDRPLAVVGTEEAPW